MIGKMVTAATTTSAGADSLQPRRACARRKTSSCPARGGVGRAVTAAPAREAGATPGVLTVRSLCPRGPRPGAPAGDHGVAVYRPELVSAELIWLAALDSPALTELPPVRTELMFV